MCRFAEDMSQQTHCTAFYLTYLGGRKNQSFWLFLQKLSAEVYSDKMESDLKGLGDLTTSFASDSKAEQRCTDGKVCATLTEGASAFNFFIACVELR